MVTYNEMPDKSFYISNTYNPENLEKSVGFGLKLSNDLDLSLVKRTSSCNDWMIIEYTDKDLKDIQFDRSEDCWDIIPLRWDYATAPAHVKDNLKNNAVRYEDLPEKSFFLWQPAGTSCIEVWYKPEKAASAYHVYRSGSVNVDWNLFKNQTGNTCMCLPIKLRSISYGNS